jgi:2-polyprenyl-3-methyl-5-hydroxy-6-metoxy-1,4-benzoquinol methylase
MSEGIQKIICNSCGSSRYFLVHSQPKKPSNDSLLSDSNKSYRISEEEIEKPEKIVRCSECGLCFAVQNKQLIKDIGSDYLNMVDDEYTKEEKGRREQSRIILSRIEKYKKTGRLLDIGCGVGLFLDEAKRNGFDVEGVELSKWARDYAKERFNIKALYKTFDDARFQNKCFDVIVMLDVIEHLEDPKTMLNEIWRILKNDGVLYISTPDIESVLSRMLGGKWCLISRVLSPLNIRLIPEYFRYPIGRSASSPTLYSYEARLPRFRVSETLATKH